MPYVSGRDWRVRRMDFGRTYDLYSEEMRKRYPKIRMYGYTVFWREVVKTGEKIRREKVYKWCPTCCRIDEGKDWVKKIKKNNDIVREEWTSTDWNLNLDIDILETTVLNQETEHRNRVKNQYDEYKRLKDSLLASRSTSMFIIVQDFSKLEPQKGDTYQDLIITLYYFDITSPLILKSTFLHYIAEKGTKNDR